MSYISILFGYLLVSAISLLLERFIAHGNLERNNLIGIRTSATLTSDTAWHTGHTAARPYLIATCIIGVIGIIGTAFNTWLSLLFIAQILCLLYAAYIAHQKAKSTI